MKHVAQNCSYMCLLVCVRVHVAHYEALYSNSYCIISHCVLSHLLSQRLCGILRDEERARIPCQSLLVQEESTRS